MMQLSNNESRVSPRRTVETVGGEIVLTGEVAVVNGAGGGGVQELIEATPDDLSHAGPRSGHDWRRPRADRSRRSSGLLIDGSEAVATWTYRAVVLKLRWPKRTWMVRRSVPDSSKWVAKLWRRVWAVTSLFMPAA